MTTSLWWFFLFPKRNLFPISASTEKQLPMKKSIITLGLISLFILSTAMQCDDDDVSESCENTAEHLLGLKMNIESLASASVCSEDFECRYIAFGSKPCGGPWEYLIYSTSIDTLALTNLVTEYNQLQANYNVTCNMVSNCMAAIPPIGFECVNNQCVPIF